ncbi:MAG: hypothetical protein FJ388_00805 [Verrucomicrobia bacterium]|nr:hypothetical protein [Verrucomicrobiota bacterium]
MRTSFLALRRLRRAVAAWSCAVLAACGAAVALDQGFDDTTGVIHNGAWHDGVPLGALGCGKFEMLPAGWFSRFTINHNWDEPFWDHRWKASRATFFAIRAASASTLNPQPSTVRMLRFGRREQELPGVAQVAHVAYRGRFPFADVEFKDAALPVGIALRAWSPLVPHNAKDSSLPVAFFEFTLANTNAQPVEVLLMFSMEHFIGCGGYQVHGDHRTWREQDGNRVEPATVKNLGGASAPRPSGSEEQSQGAEAPPTFTGLRFFSTREFTGMKLNSAGEYWLLSDGPTTARGWGAASDGKEVLDLLSGNPQSAIRNPQSVATAGAICRKVTVPAGGKQKVLFMFAWWMPHHVTMDGKDHGHYYQRSFDNPSSLAAYAVAQRERLARETAEWGGLVNRSNLPEWLKRMILDGTHPMFCNTLLTRDGEFAVHEDPSWMEGALGTMDQRTVSHVFAGTFFPELSRAELELFRRCQQPDGEITHFCGNIYQVIGNPRVYYGITRWPDLPMVYIWQVLKHYRWTGDRKFLDESWPGIKRALDWLAAADRDGDGVPEGGTTYDAGVQYGGNFVFTASVYVAALQSAIEIARLQNDDATRAACEQRLERARAALQRLWVGRYFAKCLLPDRGLIAPTLFSPQLVGEWMARMAGLPRTVSAQQAQSSAQALLEVNGRLSPGVMIDEFTPDGRNHNDRCWFTYQYTYFCGPALAEGHVDDALEAGWRHYDHLYHCYGLPWNVPINFMPLRTDPPPDGASYMSAMAAWWWLPQLAGASMDVPAGALRLSPRTSAKLPELHLPLFFPRAWLWLDYAPAKKIFRLKVLRAFGEPVVFKQVAADADGEAITLPAPFVAREGATLDLEPWRAKLVAVTARAPLLEHRAFLRRHEGLPTLSWTAVSSETNILYHADHAYDGYIETRWESSGPLTSDLWWQLDLGRVETFKTVDAETSPAGLTIELAADGKQWRPMDPAAARHEARFIRLRPAPSAPTQEPWRIFEVTVRP